ncbi:hypothetical protein [Botryobacter ruber]|uniref:hypothetical protein n=1 Tax=Botryobacter ruber TaxID=2171629 RepID=UPI000F6508A9|nr:hypothetical protein [Botryobacter ruber]
MVNIICRVKNMLVDRNCNPDNGYPLPPLALTWLDHKNLHLFSPTPSLQVNLLFKIATNLLLPRGVDLLIMGGNFPFQANQGVSC